MKHLIIYHNADFDGLCSMSIIRQWCLQNEETADVIGYNYGKDTPTFNPEDYNLVWVVDVCLDTKTMLSLKEASKIVWIDHHATSIQDSVDNGYNDAFGIRREGKGACELCWEMIHLYDHKEVPLFVQWLSAYDVWDKKRFDWENVTLPFQYGMRNRFNLNAEEFFTFFTRFTDKTNEIDKILRSGQTIIRYIRNTGKTACNNYAFEITIGDKIKGLAMMTAHFGALEFEQSMHERGCQVAVCINKRKDSEDYNISVYAADSDMKDFNIGEYMKTNYRGGGHRSAASGKLTQQEFLRLLTEKKI